MKKLFCALLLVTVLGTGACGEGRWIFRLGVLTKLNSTAEEFRDVWSKTFAPQMANLDVAVRFYDSMTAMQMALDAGDINEIVLPDAAADYLMNRNPNYEATLVLRAREPYGLAFGFRGEDEALRRDFNRALLEMRGNWTLAALEGHYIDGAGVEEPMPVEFEKFEGADTIRVAVTGDLPPIDFIAADGTPAGFNTAVLAEVGRFLRRNIELISVEAGARTAALASGRADVVFWYEVDTSRTTQLDVPDGVILSDPYYEWSKFVHLRKIYRGGSGVWDVRRNILDLYHGR